MNMIKKILLAFTVTILTFQTASASRVEDYRCNSGGMRGPFPVTSVGLGVLNDGYDQGEVVFCIGPQTPRYCYASKYSAKNPIGRADYVTLLTALTLKKRVTFYCSGQRVENIHVHQ